MLKRNGMLLPVFLAALGLLAGMLQHRAWADDHAEGGSAQEAPEAQEQPKREIDLEVISDPGHEKMNQTAPDRFEVLFETTAGDFTVVVTRAWAPRGADRFYSLVKNGYYDGNKFFRVVPGFVVQWGLHGDPSVNEAWFKNREAGQIKDDPVKQSNTKGRLVFASAGPDTRTTQLFINFGNNKRLDGMGFAPFGEIKGDGMKVVSKIYDEYDVYDPRMGDRDPTKKVSQMHLAQLGNKDYADKFFPRLDAIKTATIVEKDQEKGAEEDAGE